MGRHQPRRRPEGLDFLFKKTVMPLEPNEPTLAPAKTAGACLGKTKKKRRPPAPLQATHGQHRGGDHDAADAVRRDHEGGAAARWPRPRAGLMAQWHRTLTPSAGRLCIAGPWAASPRVPVSGWETCSIAPSLGVAMR